MKSNHPLLAAMLSGAVVVAAGTGAGAKEHHHGGNNGSQGSTSVDGAQKSGDTSDHGGSKNQDSGAASANAGDKGAQPPGTPDGPMKKGDLPGKTGSHNAGSHNAGSNAADSNTDSEDKGHDHSRAGKNTGDPGKPENIVADGPGHKIKKPEDKTKKVTNVFRPHVNKDHAHPTTTATITQRNAIGVALHDAKDPQKPELDSKTGNKLANAPIGPNGSPNIKAVTTVTTPTTIHPGPLGEVAPKSGPAISGSRVGRPGANLASIGGPNKTMVGVLSGSSFKPKHP
jgi:hypothetical protein